MNTENTVFQPACRRQCNASKGKICEDIEKHHERFETKDLHDKLLSITCHLNQRHGPLMIREERQL